ncbi:unnamed protein product [Caenorhabditis sp. 36 PRJEB53466]|nr:unnamed protein product [Caenorhabditis sp. 36 PRJEB53466]
MEQNEKFQEYLRDVEKKPVPLTHNFYESYLRRNPTSDDTITNSSTSSGSTISGALHESTTAQIVKDLLTSNQQLIEEAAMRQAATAVNVNTQQYTNLIPLSFDQEEFIRQHEAQNRKK